VVAPVKRAGPLALRGLVRTLIFLANALLFIAIASPPTLPRMVLGVAAVVAVNGLWIVVGARLHASS
jgi:hypothetical protein